MDSHYRFEVEIELAEIIDGSFEGFLDTISERAVDSPCLMEICYGVIEATSETTLKLWVSGDVSAVIEDLDDDEAASFLAAHNAQPLAGLPAPPPEPVAVETGPRSRRSPLATLERMPSSLPLASL